MGKRQLVSDFPEFVVVELGLGCLDPFPFIALIDRGAKSDLNSCPLIEIGNFKAGLPQGGKGIE